MKYTCVLVIIGIAVLAAPALADYDSGAVIIDRVSGYFGGVGGEFTISFSSSNSLLKTGGYVNSQTANIWVNTQTTGLSPLAPVGYNNETWPYASPANMSFQTFCLEAKEHVYLPSHLIEQAIVNESGSPVSTYAVFGGTGSYPGDPLDARTAYLYTKFATGTLTGYDYGAGRAASAVDLQNAIWFLEGESGGVNNSFVALANTAVAAGGEWDGKGIGNVRVLNMWDNSTPTARQDMLYLVPVPGAMLLGFLGLGYAGMRLRKVA